MKEYQHKADLIQAIAHPVRLRILEVLSYEPACVCDLVTRLEKRQPYISQQLAVLRQAGLVLTRREGWNIFYQLNASKVNLIREVLREICRNKTDQYGELK